MLEQGSSFVIDFIEIFSGIESMMHKHDKQLRVVKACGAFSYIHDR